MASHNISIRLNRHLLQYVDLYAKKYSVTRTKVIEIALFNFFEGDIENNQTDGLLEKLRKDLSLDDSFQHSLNEYRLEIYKLIQEQIERNKTNQ